MKIYKKIVPLVLAVLASFLLPISSAGATVANGYSCSAGDTNGGGTLAICTHSVLVGTPITYAATSANSLTVTNLILNPSITSLTTLNVNNGTSSLSTTVGFAGSTSALLANSSGSGNFYISFANTSSSLSAIAGNSYNFSLYAKDVNTAVSWHAGFDFYSSNYTWLGNGIGISSVPSIGVWTRFSATATAPVSTAYIVPYVITNATPSAGSSIYFDAGLLTNSSILYPYFDGSFATSVNAGITSNQVNVLAWTGTANLSTSTWYTITYTCTAGDTLSGTSCTHLNYTVTTYAATLITSAPTSSTTFYTCPAGYSLTGVSTCSPVVVNYLPTTSNTCPSGATLTTSAVTSTGFMCVQPVATIAATANTLYTCPSGSTLTGSTCSIGGTINAATGSTGLTCPSGGVLTSGNCISTTGTNYAAVNTISYSCPSGGILISLSCVTASSTYSAQPANTYSCTSGTLTTNYVYASGYVCVTQGAFYYSSSSCSPNLSAGSPYYSSYLVYPCQYLATYSSPVLNTTYSCSSGGVNNYDGTCTLQAVSTSAVPSNSYSCPSGGILNVTACVYSSSSYVAISKTTYSCSSGALTTSFVYASGYSCVTGSTVTTASSSIIYSCPAGDTATGASGSFCTVPAYSFPATVVTACSGVDTLVNKLCVPTGATMDATVFYVGSCVVNFIFNNLTGVCTLITTSLVNVVGQYLCTVSISLIVGGYTYTSNTDNSGADGNGNYVSCQLISFGSASSVSGFFICNSSDISTAVGFSYLSATDLTGTSSNAYIWCVYGGDTPIDTTDAHSYIYTIPVSTDIDPCAATLGDFTTYLACVLAQP